MRKTTFVISLALAAAALVACEEETTGKKGEKEAPSDPVPPASSGKEGGTNTNDAGTTTPVSDAGPTSDAGTGDNTARCAQLSAELGPEAAERGVSVDMLCSDPPPGTAQACAEYNQKCR